MVKRRRATDKFFVAVALEVFGGQLAEWCMVAIGGTWLSGFSLGWEEDHSFPSNLKIHFVRAIKVCWDVVLT